MQVYLVDSQGYYILHHDPDQIMYGRIQDMVSNWDDFTPKTSAP